jgi:hypothetical protein
LARRPARRSVGPSSRSAGGFSRPRPIRPSSRPHRGRWDRTCRAGNRSVRWCCRPEPRNFPLTFSAERFRTGQGHGSSRRGEASRPGGGLPPLEYTNALASAEHSRTRKRGARLTVVEFFITSVLSFAMPRPPARRPIRKTMSPAAQCVCRIGAGGKRHTGRSPHSTRQIRLDRCRDEARRFEEAVVRRGGTKWRLRVGISSFPSASRVPVHCCSEAPTSRRAKELKGLFRVETRVGMNRAIPMKQS